MCKGILKMYLLFSLAKGESHAYRLLKDFRGKMASWKGGKCIGTGEFYAALSKLEQAELVRHEWSGEPRPKKVFSLTPAGHRLVGTAKERFADAMALFRKTVPELFRKGGSVRR